MDRVKALARIDTYFQTGKFESDLNRRIAFKTESNLPNSVNALQSYLDKEIAPYLSAMGFSCPFIQIQLLMLALSFLPTELKALICRL
jgi:hypothetical protein